MTGSADWKITGVSVRGAAHARSGKGNQDAFGYRLADPPGAGLLAAVSDGHGASIHCRSAVGADLAVQSALRMLGQDGAEGCAARETLAEWRRAVGRHAVRNPFSAEEIVQCGGGCRSPMARR